MAVIDVAYIPTASGSVIELLGGQTVISGGTDGITNEHYANDAGGGGASHFSRTKSERPSFAGSGSRNYWWGVDFGDAHEVHAFRVWGTSGWDWGYKWTNTIEWSDNGSTWTSTPFTRTSATVPTGNTSPYATAITEHTYDITTPSTHRWWRIKKTGTFSLQFFQGDGTVAMFIDGIGAAGAVVWQLAPETIDNDAGTSECPESGAIGLASDVFWRGALATAESIGAIALRIGFDVAGPTTVLVQAGDLDDWSDAATVAVAVIDATGSLTADDYDLTFDPPDAYRYWQLVLDDGAQDVCVFEVALEVGAEPPVIGPGGAILEIYVHDEDASRWGTATWATGAATGTEGIWSAAGWTDVTPEGVNAHIIWGSRDPDRGILSRQNAASWNVETYDPERKLDPGNFDSPFYPQIVAGLPIRISHDALVIRTGYVDRISYKFKRPDYRGQLLCTDTISLANQAMVPEDSILDDNLGPRIGDAIEASAIAVGGIPLIRPEWTGPALAPLDTDNPRERSLWDHITAACEEVLYVPFVMADASIGVRDWGQPWDRAREITAANLEDLEAVSHEDGLYSVARVQGDDPDVPPIERETAPLPRYGRRVIERTELTLDPEAWAAAVLSDRGWPGTRYDPGTIHCFTAADVNYFGSMLTMERVTVTVPGVVSITGRILGGEMWVEHRRQESATWMFKYFIAQDGSSAIGLTTLVADGTGDTLLDDATGDDYLEAD